jgi:hypothetical protein
MQELREDLDVILTMIMQDANVGAGMLKVFRVWGLGFRV